MKIFEENEKLSWEVEDGVLTISGEGRIPDYYTKAKPQAPWEDIADTIVELELEEGITEIGISAFSHLKNLTLAIFPRTLQKIHYGAFEGCSKLEDVMYDTEMSFVHMYEKMEKSLKRSHSIREKEKYLLVIVMGMRAFAETPWAIANWGNYYVASGVLIDCFHATRDVVIPDHVDEIGTMAFQNTNVATVQFPEGLKSIDSFAFQNTSLTEVVLPASIRRVDFGAFSDTPLKKCIFEGNGPAEIDRHAFQNTNISMEIEPPVQEEETTHKKKAAPVVDSRHFDAASLHAYEVLPAKCSAEGFSCLTIQPKPVKADGLVGFETADVISYVAKLLSGKSALVGLVVDDEKKVVTGTRTLTWDTPKQEESKQPEMAAAEEAAAEPARKLKKKIVRKTGISFSMSTEEIVLNKDMQEPYADNGKGTYFGKNDVPELFSNENALGMIAAGSIEPAGNHTRVLWYCTNSRTSIGGPAEYRLMEAWLAENGDYQMQGADL